MLSCVFTVVRLYSYMIRCLLEYCVNCRDVLWCVRERCETPDNARRYNMLHYPANKTTEAQNSQNCRYAFHAWRTHHGTLLST